MKSGKILEVGDIINEGDLQYMGPRYAPYPWHNVCLTKIGKPVTDDEVLIIRFDDPVSLRQGSTVTPWADGDTCLPPQ